MKINREQLKEIILEEIGEVLDEQVPKAAPIDIDFYKGLRRIITYTPPSNPSPANRKHAKMAKLYGKAIIPKGVKPGFHGHDLAMLVGQAYDAIINNTKASGMAARIQRNMMKVYAYLKAKKPAAIAEFQAIGKGVAY